MRRMTSGPASRGLSQDGYYLLNNSRWRNPGRCGLRTEPTSPYGRDSCTLPPPWIGTAGVWCRGSCPTAWKCWPFSKQTRASSSRAKPGTGRSRGRESECEWKVRESVLLTSSWKSWGGRTRTVPEGLQQPDRISGGMEKLLQIFQ